MSYSLPNSSSVEFISTEINKLVALEGLDFNQGSTITSTSTLPLIKQSIIRKRLRRNGEGIQECNCSGRTNNNKKMLFSVLLASTFTSVNSAPSPFAYARRDIGKSKALDSVPFQQSINEASNSNQLPIYHKRSNVNTSSVVSINSTTYNATTYNPTSIETNSTSVIIPDGWLPTPRPTSFYPVPLIIALSVIVSLLLAGTIIGAVLLRRDRRKRRLKKRQEEGGTAEKGLKDGSSRNEKGVKGLLKRLKGKGRSKKIKSRKHGGKNNSDNNAGGSSSTALNREQNNTRRRSNATNLNNNYHPNGSTTSLGIFATTSRQQSNLSPPPSPAPSLHPVQSRTSVSLGNPRSIETSIHQDELPIRSNSIVSLSGDRTTDTLATLVIPGPPAYRPNSSRVQRIIPPVQVEEWHWPNEKHNPVATSSTSTSTPQLSTQSSTSSDFDLTPPPIDRSTFSAHVATDDKATLARLRELAQISLDLQYSSINLASAPVFDDDVNVDEDGFERFHQDEEEIVDGEMEMNYEAEEEVEEVSTTLGSLPLPPRPITTSYIPTLAPSYGEEFRRRVIVQEPTAPPPDDDDNDEQWEREGEGEDDDDTNTAVI